MASQPSVLKLPNEMDVFPSFAAVVSDLIKQIFYGVPWAMEATDLQFAGLAGLAAIPFGLAGGWLFWRIAVRPAVTKTADIGSVFD